MARKIAWQNIVSILVSLPHLQESYFHITSAGFFFILQRCPAILPMEGLVHPPSFEATQNLPTPFPTPATHPLSLTQLPTTSHVSLVLRIASSPLGMAAEHVRRVQARKKLRKMPNPRHPMSPAKRHLRVGRSVDGKYSSFSSAMRTRPNCRRLAS